MQFKGMKETKRQGRTRDQAVVRRGRVGSCGSSGPMQCVVVFGGSTFRAHDAKVCSSALAVAPITLGTAWYTNALFSNIGYRLIWHHISSDHAARRDGLLHGGVAFPRVRV
jgi:hypothetical protein